MVRPVSGFLSRPRGFAIIFAAFIFFVIGVIYGLEQLYLMFAAIVTLPAASYAIGWSALRSLRLRRRLARQVSEGDSIEVELEVTNQGRYGKLLFRVDDELPQWLESEDAGGHVPRLAAGETERLRYRARALKRGIFAVGPASLSACDPVALFEFHTQAAPASEVVVHPQPVVLDDLPLGGEPRFHGRRATRQRAEDGIDFHATREYQPGDDLRRIHWKSTARRDVITVLEFERSNSGGVTVVLDLRPESQVGLGRHSTLEYGVKIAAGIAQQTLARGGSFGLVARGAQDRSLHVSRGRAGLKRVFDVLAAVQANGSEAVGQTLRSLAGRLLRGRAVVVISPAVDRETVTALSGLARHGVDCALVMLRADSFAVASAGAQGRASAAAAPAREAYQAHARALRRTGVTVREVRCFDMEFMKPFELEAAHERASAA